MDAGQEAAGVGQKAIEISGLALTAGWIVIVFIGLAGVVILWYMVNGKINLEKLISEDDGTASLSRFQFLVFTFVIAMSLFLVIVGQTPPAFPDKIPPEVLALLGISGGSYVISKGIQKTGKGSAGAGAPGAGASAPGVAGVGGPTAGPAGGGQGAGSVPGGGGAA